MDCNCSLSGLGGICCGENRGATNIVNLNECQQNIQVHLSSCHISKSNLKEYELILLRAGLFHVMEEQYENITVCPNHRNNLGRFWRPLRSCQYPEHSGPVRQCKGRDVFNSQLSRTVFKLYGKLVQIGSPICRQCRDTYKEKMKKEGAWVQPTKQDGDSDDKRYD